MFVVPSSAGGGAMVTGAGGRYGNPPVFGGGSEVEFSR